MGAAFDKTTIAKAYARWAPVYDLVFGAVFERGRKAAVNAAERIGGRILEVGVGTGLSLPDYAWTNRIVGIDLSAPMLRAGAMEDGHTGSGVVRVEEPLEVDGVGNAVGNRDWLAPVHAVGDGQDRPLSCAPPPGSGMLTTVQVVPLRLSARR